MELTLTAPRSELGGVLSAALARAPTRGGGPRVVIDISLQPPNNLLHDGRRWATFSPSRLSTLARATQRRHADADFLVHASYLFLNAVEAGARPGDTLRPIVDGALAAERIVMDGAVPACVVRLGYVYGPESRDLRAYRRAFRLGRPYWAGPPETTQRHLHSDDAVRALLAAARQRAQGSLLSASDDLPASFAAFMDEFARLMGNPLPLHLPAATRPLAHVIVAEGHMQMVELESGTGPVGARPRSFAPEFADYRGGLRQVVIAWASGGRRQFETG